MTERQDAVKIEGRQYVVVGGGNLRFKVGTVVTLTRDDGSRTPWFLAEGTSAAGYLNMDRVMLLAETEETVTPKPEPVTEFEVGTVYVGTDGELDLIQKQEDGSTSRIGYSGNLYLYSLIKETDDTWTVATAEQAAEFNKRKLQYQLDNLVEGEVYQFVGGSLQPKNVILRYSHTASGLYGNHLNTDDGKYFNWGHFGTLDDIESIRPATAEEIALLEGAEIKAGDRVSPVSTKPELPKHKYAVGDKLKVVTKEGKWHDFPIGTELTVIGLGGKYGDGHEKGICKYKTESLTGYQQYLLETQLEPVVEQFIPEVGKIYIGGGAGGNLLQVSNITGNLVGGTGDWSALGYISSAASTMLTGFADSWTEATPEQAVKLLQAKVDHSDATEDDLKQLSELMPLDNPELTDGGVYVDNDNWIFRFSELNEECGYANYYFTIIASVASDGEFYHSSSQSADSYREALPYEVTKLESAEKERGCEYVKPLVNKQGTVIEVGQYYSGLNEVLKVTEIGEYIVKYSGFELPGGRIPSKPQFGTSSGFLEMLVPATPAKIEQFKQAEAKANFQLEVGKKYKAEVKGDTVTFTVKKVDNGLVVVMQTMLNGHINYHLHVLDSPIWQKAVEVE